VDHLGRYRIDGVLGQGRMGRVYRAFDETHARPVALKVLHPAGEDTGRLLHEARASAALDHPNIVTIHEVGEVDGGVYIAMELIEGRPLRASVGDPAIPLPQRIAWLVELARTLAAAHERGVIHRSVRPENILVRSDGTLKLLEFGLARNTSTAATSPVAQFEATAPGSSLDTPLFSAPEQIRNQPVDARADQFAWGVVAYELLTGVHPWAPARDPIALIAAILTRPARPLHDVVPGAPEALARAVDRALLTEPKARFPTMAELLTSLDPPAPARSRLLGLMAAPARAAGPLETMPPAKAEGFDTTTRFVPTESTPIQRPRWPLIVGLVALAAVVGAALAASLT
jgi:eukaryotic-like serine/threonine-protein kinase